MITILFFLVALLYSMVGFGGGSSYVAMFALMGSPYEMIPALSLSCNIIVVSCGSYHFIKNGHFSWTLSWPFLVFSVPMAFLGAMIPISKQVFLTLLGFCLVLVSTKLIFVDRKQADEYKTRVLSIGWAMLIGALLGLLSGMVGIGGGIFLAPTLLLLRWGTPKQIAAIAAVFILVNSLSGLTGQLIKHKDLLSLTSYWPIFASVWCGGLLGSAYGAGYASQRWVKRGTATLVMIVGMRVLLQAINLSE